MTEAELLEFSQPIVDVYTAMEHDLMVAVAAQIAKDGFVSAASKWRMQKLAEAGELNRTAVNIIASYTGIQSDVLTEAITSAAYDVIDNIEPALQAAARDGVISDAAVSASASAKRVISTYHKQAKSDLNLVNTVMRYKAKEAYVDLVNRTYDAVNAIEDVSNRQELLNTLGKHTMSAVTGAESRSAAVRKCIQEFNAKGIPAFVDAAGRQWSPEAYVNMDIKTTVSNVAHAAQDARCDEYGIDLIEVSSHKGARPKCAPCQGRIFSRSNKSGIAHDGSGREIQYSPLSETSYGEPDGLFGINCHHKKYPFIDGVNFQRYFPYEKDENDAYYAALQKQRQLERRIREQKREIDMLKEVGDDEGVKAARAKLREQQAKYKEFSEKNDLAMRKSRTAVSRKNTQKPLDSGGGSGIISENSKKPITKITDNTIANVPVAIISGYTDKQNLFIQQQHKELLSYSRDKNENKEVAFVFKNGLTEQKIFTGTDDKLDFGNELSGSNLFVMHNHPRNGSYSDTDIAFLLSNDNVKSLSIVKNSGKVEVLTKSENYDKMQLINSFKRCYKKYVKTNTDSEINKAVSAFLNQNKEMIEWIRSP